MNVEQFTKELSNLTDIVYKLTERIMLLELEIRMLKKNNALDDCK